MIIDTNKKRLDVCKQAAKCSIAHPDDLEVLDNHYDIVFDAVGFAKTRQKSIQTIRQGGLIIHIGLSQGTGDFDFRKTLIQKIDELKQLGRNYTDETLMNILKLVSHATKYENNGRDYLINLNTKYHMQDICLQ
mgnify:CR=1 FL=1